jgi:serine/threonine protein kinase
VSKKLGKGGFGKVYLARHKVSGEEIAVKKIPLRSGLPAD